MINTDAPYPVSTGVVGEAYPNNFGTDFKADGRNPLFLFARFVLNLHTNATALRQAEYALLIFFAMSDGLGGLRVLQRYPMEGGQPFRGVGGQTIIIYPIY